MSYSGLKLLHILCVVISITGFSLRAGAMVFAAQHLSKPWVKRLPHIVDTLLLLSGLGLLSITGLSPFQVPWLGLKLLLLLAYIVFGALGLRYAPKRYQRLLCCAVALACAATMAWLALTKPAL
ncbi:SirB2 family protein [Maricurvus nonylphenolicus]|uniref:SirB2 family protein n=1 Tax=Maricurvus nonylphenolicus TaxID=1008307 RepID=UPI0036F2A836